MNVFFDNCTPPALATTLDGFVRHFGHRACHIRDLTELPNGRHSADLEWIEFRRSDARVWIFMTGDGRVLKNAAERQALRSAGLHGFVLAPAYQKTPQHQVASLLLWRWPEIEALVGLLAPPSMHEIPINHSARLRALPL